MSDTHILHVATHGELVGQIRHTSVGAGYGFAYDPQWIEKKGAFPLSPPLPLRGEAPAAGTVHRFLENLLPEGRALEIASQLNQVSKANTFALIRLLGKEPVGAFTFFGLDTSNEEAQQLARDQDHEPLRRVISDEELSQRIRERDSIPFPVWDRKVRLSLAGFQDKLQVLVEGEKMSLADGALSSTHLLKPESRNPGMPYMVANEHFCMSLAAELGLRTAPVSLRRVPEPILLIERFDRQVKWNAGRTKAEAIRRLHVIDACQALDLPSTYKYERTFGSNRDVQHIREGVSFQKLFSLSPKMETAGSAISFMIRWAITQLLLGNSDAHGKNMSYFLSEHGLTPAPAYDLVSINAYGDSVQQDMAMAYGDAFHLEDVTPIELAHFAKVTKVPARQLAREMTRMAKVALKAAPLLAKSEMYVGDERDVINSIAQFVCAQALRLLEIAPHVPKVTPDMI